MEISTHKPLARVMPGLVTLWRLGSGVMSVISMATEASEDLQVSGQSPRTMLVPRGHVVSGAAVTFWPELLLRAMFGSMVLLQLVSMVLLWPLLTQGSLGPCCAVPALFFTLPGIVCSQLDAITGKWDLSLTP